MQFTRRAFAITATASSVLSSVRAEAATEPYPYERVGQRAPAFTASRFGGGSVGLSDYHGKTLILAFGGLWCPDCIVEEQELNVLAHMVETDQSIAFLALHSGDNFGRWGAPSRNIDDASAAITAYRRQMNTEYPLAFDLDFSIANNYGMRWFPTILIIAPDGVIRGSTTDLRRRTAVRFAAEARAIT